MRLFRKIPVGLAAVCAIVVLAAILIIFDRPGPYDTTFEDLLISEGDFRAAVAHPSFRKYTHVCFLGASNINRWPDFPAYQAMKKALGSDFALAEDMRWPIILFNENEFTSVAIERFDQPNGLEGNCCCFQMDEIRVAVDPTHIVTGTDLRGEIVVWPSDARAPR